MTPDFELAEHVRDAGKVPTDDFERIDIVGVAGSIPVLSTCEKGFYSFNALSLFSF